MSMIIVPGQHRSDGNPFANLLNDEQQLHRAMSDFAKILARSFRDDAILHGVDFAKRHNTEKERKRRADIMGRWYREMRDAGYGYIQTMDEIPKALRAELDGDNYMPPQKNRLWAAEGAQ